MRRKGDLVPIDLGKILDSEGSPARPELEGVVVHVRHEGPRKVRDWQFAIQRIRAAERQRLRGIPPDEIERDDKGEARAFQTVDGLEELARFSREVAADVVTKVEGLGYDVADPADELNRLDLCSLLLEPIMSAQALKEPEAF